MTKADIVNEISSKTGLDRFDVQKTIEFFMKEVKESLANGESVYLRGFGSFVIKKRAEKVARNISKNEPMTIPAHSIPAFKPSPDFVADVKK